MNNQYPAKAVRRPKLHLPLFLCELPAKAPPAPAHGDRVSAQPRPAPARRRRHDRITLLRPSRARGGAQPWRPEHVQTPIKPSPPHQGRGGPASRLTVRETRYQRPGLSLGDVDRGRRDVQVGERRARPCQGALRRPSPANSPPNNRARGVNRRAVAALRGPSCGRGGLRPCRRGGDGRPGRRRISRQVPASSPIRFSISTRGASSPVPAPSGSPQIARTWFSTATRHRRPRSSSGRYCGRAGRISLNTGPSMVAKNSAASIPT